MSLENSGLMYSKEHEWVRMIGDQVVRIGISDFAQSELGDIVFVELPAIGTEVVAGAILGSIESVKTVTDLYSPVSGKVVRVNDSLEAYPELVNTHPDENGWMVEVEISQQAELNDLLTPEQYDQYIRGEG